MLSRLQTVSIIDGEALSLIESCLDGEASVFGPQAGHALTIKLDH